MLTGFWTETYTKMGLYTYYQLIGKSPHVNKMNFFKLIKNVRKYMGMILFLFL